MKNSKFLIAPLLLLISMAPVQAQSPMVSLSKYTGDWKADYVMWMDTSSESMSFQLSVHNEMKMNNLFFTSYYTGTVMGMAYEAAATIGYDLQKGKFESTWMDNMNSGITYMEGKGSAESKIIAFQGTGCDPKAASAPQMREVLTLTDPSHFKIEMFTMMQEKERKTLEISFTKK